MESVHSIVVESAIRQPRTKKEHAQAINPLDSIRAEICLARLATGRLANVFGGEFVHLSDLVCVICLIA